MSPFEMIMLICFGAAWPFSIHKSLTSKSTEGKSSLFLIIVLVGYIAGMLNKIFYSYDAVIYLYLINFIMVAVDLGLYYYNKRNALVANQENN